MRDIVPETNDFTLVTRRKRRCDEKRVPQRLGRAAEVRRNHEELDCDKVDPDPLIRILNQTLVEIRDTSFTKHILSRLTESLNVLKSTGISEILCYGLGRFSQYKSPRYQLALLRYLKTRYDNARVYVYDPLFCPEEVQVLRTLGLEVIEENEEGKRVIRDDITTLVFMPHCSKQLTNNFLYGNWGDRLNNCILLTNSFSLIIENCLPGNISDTENYIARIRPYVTEIQLENSFVYKEVFNDLNIHIFNKQDLLRVPSDFWDSREEPRYLNSEIGFVRAIKPVTNNIQHTKKYSDDE